MLYHLSKASGLPPSPSTVNFFGKDTLMLSLGSESGVGVGTGAGPPASPPQSDMSSESLLLELSESSGSAATGAFLDDPFCGDSGNPPGVTVAAFARSRADSSRSHCMLSLASCLAASSMENCFLAAAVGVALTNLPCSSLVLFSPFLDPSLEGLLLLRFFNVDLLKLKKGNLLSGRWRISIG